MLPFSFCFFFRPLARFERYSPVPIETQIYLRQGGVVNVTRARERDDGKGFVYLHSARTHVTSRVSQIYRVLKSHFFFFENANPFFFFLFREQTYVCITPLVYKYVYAIVHYVTCVLLYIVACVYEVTAVKKHWNKIKK